MQSVWKAGEGAGQNNGGGQLTFRPAQGSPEQISNFVAGIPLKAPCPTFIGTVSTLQGKLSDANYTLFEKAIDSEHMHGASHVSREKS